MADPAPQVHKPRRRRRRLAFTTALFTTYLLVVMFGGCADSLLLHPTTDSIETEGATRAEIAVVNATPVEVFVRQVNIPSGGEPEAYLLVLDGNGGRAESAIFWGDDIARSHALEIWSMNYPGYGRSQGKAKLASIPPAALATFDAMKQKAGDKPVLIWGASLGSTAALHIAANRLVSGLVLTNPPPLRQLILGRYGWWNLWLAACPVAFGVPAELDSVANAAKVKAPAVIVTAGQDTIVPAEYQQKVIDAYRGPKQTVSLPNAGHNTPAAYGNPDGWKAGVDWLWSQISVGSK